MLIIDELERTIILGASFWQPTTSESGCFVVWGISSIPFWRRTAPQGGLRQARLLLDDIKTHTGALRPFFRAFAVVRRPHCMSVDFRAGPLSARVCAFLMSLTRLIYLCGLSARCSTVWLTGSTELVRAQAR